LLTDGHLLAMTPTGRELGGCKIDLFIPAEGLRLINHHLEGA